MYHLHWNQRFPKGVVNPKKKNWRTLREVVQNRSIYRYIFLHKIWTGTNLLLILFQTICLQVKWVNLWIWEISIVASPHVVLEGMWTSILKKKGKKKNVMMALVFITGDENFRKSMKNTFYQLPYADYHLPEVTRMLRSMWKSQNTKKWTYHVLDTRS